MNLLIMSCFVGTILVLSKENLLPNPFALAASVFNGLSEISQSFFLLFLVAFFLLDEGAL